MNLYLHFPFCQQKCAYCDFFSLSNQESLIDNYCQALINEIKIYGQRFNSATIDTIYLGGGTPSLIPWQNLATIFTAIRQNFNLDTDAEISLEANPNSLSQKKLNNYLKIGINRLSLGLQAWQNSLLQKIGRKSNLEDFLQAYHWAREAGFKNINVDLIFSLPGQSLNDWQESLSKVIALKPEHIACYSLELDNNSLLAQQFKTGTMQANSEQLDRQMYKLAVKLLTRAGYIQYEISNFAKEGKACQHNLDFWHSKNYLGLGAGASSLINAVAWENSKNLKEYCLQLLNCPLEASHTIAKNKIKLSQQELIANFVTLALRTKDGLNKKDFEEKFGFKFEECRQAQIQDLIKQKLLKENDSSIFLSDKGKNLLNQLSLKLGLW